MSYFKFDCEGEYEMGPQGLGMVHLGVALRSTCTYCTLSAIILNIHRELRITRIKLKMFDDQNLVRMRSILFEIKGNVNKKEPKEMD